MTGNSKKKPLTNRKAPGRKRRRVTHADFVKEPTLAMEILADLKNEGHSWRTLAEEVNEGLSERTVSHTLIREVTLGYCDSDIVEYALGIQEHPPAVEIEPCKKCKQVHTRLKQCDDERQTRTRHRVALEVDTPAEAAALRSLLARYGSRRVVGRALANGSLVIQENEHE